MDTLIAAGEPDEPQRPMTEDEKIAQYRTDYRASLQSVGQVLANQTHQIMAVPELVNQVISQKS